MKPVRFHRFARAELDEAIGYYERQQSGLGLDLQSELETVINRIQRNPEIGARYKGTEYRHCVVRRFPYVVFYRESEDTIWIVAVAHGKRRPGYWSSRRSDYEE